MQPKHLVEGIETLKKRLQDMGQLVRASLGKAMQSIVDRDESLAREVIAGDDAINALECELDELCLHLIALGQPVAVDLRLILGGMRLIVDLERIGDEAVTIAERAIILQNRADFELSPLLKELAGHTVTCLNDALGALAKLDNEAALELLNRSEKAADLSRKLSLEMTNIMIHEARVVERAQQVAFISYNLRRICERSINIAESVSFITTGACLKHADTTRSKL